MKTGNAWRWAGVVGTACFLLAATAKSDTYNFYFTKPKKGAAGETTPEAPVEKTEAAAPAASEAPPPAPAPATASTPIVVGGGNGQPVIINNNNNITVPVMARPQLVDSPVAPSLSNGTAAVVTAHLLEDRPRWRFGLGVAYAPTTTRLEGNGAESGAIASLGFDFTHWLGFNLYGGGMVYNVGAPETNFYGGVDLEIHPFHISVGRLDILELGFLVGGSTARAAYDNWGSLHIGGRATLNFDQQFGITVATRANFGTVLFEGGIVTRF